MDRSRVESANQAAEQMNEAVRESYQTIAGSAVEIQERNIRFSQSFLETWNEALRRQAESNRDMAQSLAEQTQRQQEALQTLVQESVGAYMDFLDSMFFTPRRG